MGMRRPLNIKSVISRTVPTTRTRFIRPTGRDDTICRCQPSYEQLMWENTKKEMVKRSIREGYYTIYCGMSTSNIFMLISQVDLPRRRIGS